MSIELSNFYNGDQAPQSQEFPHRDLRPYFAVAIPVDNEASREREDDRASREATLENISHGNLLRSGPLGKCNDPYCTICDSCLEYPAPAATYHQQPSAPSTLFGRAKNFQTVIQDWRKHWGSIVLNPHTKVVQKWNQFFVIACLVVIFIDPLFLLLFSVRQTYFCITFNATFATIVTVLRSITDFVYFLHMLLQFKLAYIKRSSRTFGAGEVVDDPKKVAYHYLKSYFILDIIGVLPMPQAMLWLVVPHFEGREANANVAKNILRVTVLLQYIPRCIRFLPLVFEFSHNGLVFETAWVSFGINLFIYFLAAHVVGACWYLFGLQRVNECLHRVCESEQNIGCQLKFLDCGNGKHFGMPDQIRENWRNKSGASTNCLAGPNISFNYGIYASAVPVTMNPNVISKYLYSLFWGFLQVSTLGGNLIPSYFVWEVLFSMAVIGLGLLLFALLIGNVQNFLQSIGRRQMDVQLRRHDMEVWMKRRNLSHDLRRKVRQAVRYQWAATRGVDENELLNGLPDDLHREIRRELALEYVKKVRMFQVMDQDVLDAICERLQQKFYIGKSVLMQPKYPIEQMLFILRGQLRSIGDDGSTQNLGTGDFCGEELLIKCLKYAAIPVESRHSLRWTEFSTRSVECITNVEAFSLHAKDLEFVVNYFNRNLRNPLIQGAIRYESQYLKTWAARRIQAAWRSRNLKRAANGNHYGYSNGSPN